MNFAIADISQCSGPVIADSDKNAHAYEYSRLCDRNAEDVLDDIHKEVESMRASSATMSLSTADVKDNVEWTVKLTLPNPLQLITGLYMKIRLSQIAAILGSQNIPNAWQYDMLKHINIKHNDIDIVKNLTGHDIKYIINQSDDKFALNTQVSAATIYDKADDDMTGIIYMPVKCNIGERRGILMAKEDSLIFEFTFNDLNGIIPGAKLNMNYAFDVDLVAQVMSIGKCPKTIYDKVFMIQKYNGNKTTSPIHTTHLVNSVRGLADALYINIFKTSDTVLQRSVTPVNEKWLREVTVRMKSSEVGHGGNGRQESKVIKGMSDLSFKVNFMRRGHYKLYNMAAILEEATPFTVDLRLNSALTGNEGYFCDIICLSSVPNVVPITGKSNIMFKYADAFKY